MFPSSLVVHWKCFVSWGIIIGIFHYLPTTAEINDEIPPVCRLLIGCNENLLVLVFLLCWRLKSNKKQFSSSPTRHICSKTVMFCRRTPVLLWSATPDGKWRVWSDRPCRDCIIWCYPKATTTSQPSRTFRRRLFWASSRIVRNAKPVTPKAFQRRWHHAESSHFGAEC